MQQKFEGSSSAMEAEGVSVLLRRSVERLNLRYTKVISDGDSKSVKCLNEQKLYGPDVEIKKYECVGHIQKRLGK